MNKSWRRRGSASQSPLQRMQGSLVHEVMMRRLGHGPLARGDRERWCNRVMQLLLLSPSREFVSIKEIKGNPGHVQLIGNRLLVRSGVGSDRITSCYTPDGNKPMMHLNYEHRSAYRVDDEMSVACPLLPRIADPEATDFFDPAISTPPRFVLSEDGCLRQRCVLTGAVIQRIFLSSKLKFVEIFDDLDVSQIVIRSTRRDCLRCAPNSDVAFTICAFWILPLKFRAMFEVLHSVFATDSDSPFFKRIRAVGYERGLLSVLFGKGYVRFYSFEECVAESNRIAPNPEERDLQQHGSDGLPLTHAVREAPPILLSVRTNTIGPEMVSFGGIPWSCLHSAPDRTRMEFKLELWSGVGWACFTLSSNDFRRCWRVIPPQGEYDAPTLHQLFSFDIPECIPGRSGSCCFWYSDSLRMLVALGMRNRRKASVYLLDEETGVVLRSFKLEIQPREARRYHSRLTTLALQLPTPESGGSSQAQGGQSRGASSSAPRPVQPTRSTDPDPDWVPPSGSARNSVPQFGLALTLRRRRFVTEAPIMSNRRSRRASTRQELPIMIVGSLTTRGGDESDEDDLGIDPKTVSISLYDDILSVQVSEDSGSAVTTVYQLF
ncbi:unnamed protein product [Cyprideis torosa]|uniref:Uncharacterized protein n=1 Tax=Cyprideis torosa TaxID=163714 RepID=A0A7R8WDQ9_9CRUS|nr:unnamed protein product [Cyprideis torosa]CAG0889875.1 unnamed protein product [Cyprideis torosa]